MRWKMFKLIQRSATDEQVAGVSRAANLQLIQQHLPANRRPGGRNSKAVSLIFPKIV